MDNKKILFGNDARSSIIKGVDIVANAVKVTLGYGGRVVVISETGFPSRTTKDGVTVAQSIKLRDEVLDAGAKFIKEVSQKTADEVGDGTTSVIVLMQAICREGIEAIEMGANPVLIKKQIDAACEEVLVNLEKMRVPINDKLARDVATISANNDEEIGGMIADLYAGLGPHGIVTIEDSKTGETFVDFTNGFHFDSGYMSHHFVNNFAENTCELINPYILIVEGKIPDVNKIWAIASRAAEQKRPLVIIAEDFDYSIPASLIKNKAAFQSCVIKYNFIGDTKQELMYDLCAVTGATVAESRGDKMEELPDTYLGSCEKIVIGKDETLIVAGSGGGDLLTARIADADVKIEKARNPFEKTKQEKRKARLSGRMGIVYVGGSTEVEISERRDRIDDAVRATRAAIEEGVVIGGGAALLSLSCFNGEPKNKGEEILFEAMIEPSMQILKNAGVELDYEKFVLDKMGKNKYRYKFFGNRKVSGHEWYNIKSGKLEDFFEAGIVDPYKVVKSCLQNAVSAAGQVLISEALIVSDNN